MHKTDLKLYKQMKTSVFALYKLICDEYIDLKCDKTTVENCVKEHTLKDTSSRLMLVHSGFSVIKCILVIKYIYNTI